MRPVLGSGGGMEVVLELGGGGVCATGSAGSFGSVPSGTGDGGREAVMGGSGSFTASPLISVLGSEGGGRGTGGRGRRLRTFSALRGRTIVG
ncbi:MAG: hypothetical protein ACRENE_21345, partial [Polyangiaceae bacterium]